MFYNIDYHITDRCNRKCVSCGHFIPLVPKNIKNKTMETIVEDFKALARFPKLSQNISITGGECTLHPQLREIVLLAIEYFPDRNIRITSNGTNPDKLIDLKDILIENNNLSIILTDYIHDNTLKIFDELESTGRVCMYNIDSLDVGCDNSRVKFNRTFICEDKCTTLEEATMCHYHTECIQLVDKKLYPCQYLAYYHYFQDYFQDKINVFTYGDEGIELDKCNSNEDVEDFIYNWIQGICQHCLEPLRMCGKYTNIQDLCDTKYELEEWYVKSINNE